MALQWRDIWRLYCPDLEVVAIENCDWLWHSPLPGSLLDSTPVEFCDWLARLYSIHASDLYRKAQGQFFTSPPIARFMAELSAPLDSGAWVIEPGAGLGILIAALAEMFVQQRRCHEWRVTAYETDPVLRPALTLALGFIRHWLNDRDNRFSFEVRPDDFILANASQMRPAPLLDPIDETAPHLIIANPPYFKISKTDPRTSALSEVVHGQPNIYALFMAAAAKLLKGGGQLVFITPRSFCSGAYFRQLRKWFFQAIALERVHLFESRITAFERDDVLQENIIFAGAKGRPAFDYIEVSSSHGIADLEAAVVRRVPLGDVIDVTSTDAALSIPTGQADATLQHIFRQWPDRLHTLGLNISTGPIVPFRTDALTEASDGVEAAPVLWGQHIGRMAVTWPLPRFNRPQWIRVQPKTLSLLLPNVDFVLIRRFSPKEENSRITAAPYLRAELPSKFLGIENHVNYLYRPHGGLSKAEVLGLAAFLNSRWVDQYFRVSSGNTQVSATEVRNLPMPPLTKIQRIGERLQQADGVSRLALINQIVGEELGLPMDLPNGSGGHMSKIEEAKDLLNALGLPPAQRNELAALTLLALANLTEQYSWSKAERRSIRIHDMLLFIEQNYHKRYAENTRETFRRQVLHQFEQARIVDRNPDDPTLPTNSPRTHYALSEAIFPIVQGYGTKPGQKQLEKFRAEQGALLEIYQQRRAQHKIPVQDSAGRKFHLSPGRHNQVQVAVIEEFAPRFAPGSKLLYLGDAANKILFLDQRALQKLAFPVDKHGKLPDIVLYWPKQKWLYLIEVVTSHGPVSPKRFRELESLLVNSPAERVYVSAFPDFKEYLRHARDIAWETEIWIAEAPDHLIHYNGDRFLGPPSVSKRKKTA